MLVTFFESIKYVGHQFPIAFLRIFVGYCFLDDALQALKNQFLSHAFLAEQIRDYLPKSIAPEWYKFFLETLTIPNWQIFASFILISKFVIGVSFIIGYLVRPASLLAIFLCFNLLWAIGRGPNELQDHFLIMVLFTLGWLGAGRCLGVDYYFYRKRRGIWW